VEVQEQPAVTLAPVAHPTAMRYAWLHTAWRFESPLYPDAVTPVMVMACVTVTGLPDATVGCDVGWAVGAGALVGVEAVGAAVGVVDEPDEDALEDAEEDPEPELDPEEDPDEVEPEEEPVRRRTGPVLALAAKST